MSRKCLGCGRSGHRLESCKPKAAREIRRLRAELQRRHRDNARANPGRKTRKTEKRKLAARKAYTKKNVRRTYEQKRQVDSNKNWNSFRIGLGKIEDDPWECWMRLKKDGFFNHPKFSLACGEASLLPAVVDSSAKVLSLYMQCGNLLRHAPAQARKKRKQRLRGTILLGERLECSNRHLQI